MLESKYILGFFKRERRCQGRNQKSIKNRKQRRKNEERISTDNKTIQKIL